MEDSLAADKVLMVFDGNGLIYRSYHAIRDPQGIPLTASTGVVVNAVYGFVQTFFRMLKDYQPDYVAVAMEGGKTFRHEMSADYKGTRKPTPDDLRPQFALVDAFLQAMGVLVLRREGYEADDVLGSLSRWGKERGLHVLLVTGDSDIFQLVDDHVRVVYLARSDVDVVDEEFVTAHYQGVCPTQLPDYKGLVGMGDNIPGVRGIGGTTASRLLCEYGTIQNVYAHLEELTVQKRFITALRHGEQAAYLSRDLARIVRDLTFTCAPVGEAASRPLDLGDLAYGQFDSQEVRRFLASLEMRSLLHSVPEGTLAPQGLVDSAMPEPADPEALRFERF